jgi:hypothetical protein
MYNVQFMPPSNVPCPITLVHCSPYSKVFLDLIGTVNRRGEAVLPKHTVFRCQRRETTITQFPNTSLWIRLSILWANYFICRICRYPRHQIFLGYGQPTCVYHLVTRRRSSSFLVGKLSLCPSVWTRVPKSLSAIDIPDLRGGSLIIDDDIDAAKILCPNQLLLCTYPHHIILL